MFNICKLRVYLILSILDMIPAARPVAAQEPLINAYEQERLDQIELNNKRMEAAGLAQCKRNVLELKSRLVAAKRQKKDKPAPQPRLQLSRKAKVVSWSVRTQMIFLCCEHMVNPFKV